ncbi:hypothetical protein [Persicobacter psychrovividus]|uniref:Uncharacterized protein n=1 Tax=Persicobacter psychrovividus TaxID=387638 RepID=A0ABM7VMR6_9BACT|nr:hypothetical protein PEPS_45940 [Persicobacter psychrovividus]
MKLLINSLPIENLQIKIVGLILGFDTVKVAEINKKEVVQKVSNGFQIAA